MKNNPVEHPPHYRAGNHEAIDVIQAWNLNFSLGNVIKYICRAGIKNPNKKIEDLEKAMFYLKAEIESLKISEARSLNESTSDD